MALHTSAHLSSEAGLRHDGGAIARASELLYSEFVEALYREPAGHVSTPTDLEQDTAEVSQQVVRFLGAHPTLPPLLAQLLADAASSDEDRLARQACMLIDAVATLFTSHHIMRLVDAGALCDE